MTEPESENTLQTMYVCVANDIPMVMCHEHAKAFVLTMEASNLLYSVIELPEEDGPYGCNACDLQDELHRPRIILPN